MHILILTTHEIRAPRSGGDLRVAKLINFLLSRGDKVSIIRFQSSRLDDSKNMFPVKNQLAINEVSTLPSYATPPISILTHLFSFKANLIAEKLNAAEPIDIIQSDPMAVAISGMIISKRLRIPHLILSQNCESTLASQIAKTSPTLSLPLLGKIIVNTNLAIVRSIERYVISKADLVLTPSPNDIYEMQSVGVDVKKVKILPNGTDIQPRLKDECLPVRKALGIDRSTPVVIFTGRLDYPPNRDAVMLINQIIAPGCPTVQFIILGMHPPAIEYTGNIKVLGLVDKIDDYLGASDVVIAPIRYGSGTRIKILDAWAARKPVIATSAAAAGLLSTDQENILIEDDIQRFPDRIMKLLGAPRLMEKLGRGAETISRRYLWDAIGKSYSQYLEVLTGRK